MRVRVRAFMGLVAAWIHFTLWDNITHYKTESVHFLGLMNSATKGNAGFISATVGPKSQTISPVSTYVDSKRGNFKRFGLIY